MPTPTKAPKKPDPQSTATAEPRARRGAVLLAAGAAYAATEFGLALALGFFEWGRAEALLFHSVRPWLIIAAAALVGRMPLRSRFLFYAAALLLAALSQSLFLFALGSAEPWVEALRGAIGGLLVAAAADAVVQLGRRLRGGWAGGLAAAALALLLLVPGVLRPYLWIITPAERPLSNKPDLMLLTALPLGWSEKGPLDPEGKPAAAFAKLEREFRVRPIDLLDEKSLAKGRLLLLAQPRALSPEEFAALDQWVRSGGRALILTDPALFWPSDLPLGDVRRAPAIGLLGPLLVHWGLLLERPTEPELVVEDMEAGGETRRLAMFAPGRFIVTGGSCRAPALPQIARCRIGGGEAVLVADADMLHDRLWVGPGPKGSEREARLSDNPLIIADLLDALAGTDRERGEPPVQWLSRDADRGRAIALALFPLLLAATPLALTALLRRR